MTKLDLQKHMLSNIWYMALPFRQVNYFALTLSLSQLIGLDLKISKYESLRGCVLHK